MGKKIDMTGRVCGQLTVVSEVAREGRRGTWWQCECDCGGSVVVLGGNLRSGNTKSCGCLKPRATPMEGRVFGLLSVTKRVGNGGGTAARWECLCECGNTHVAAGGNLRSGSVRSCGCLMRRGPDHHSWSGGRGRTRAGYVTVYAAGHPNAYDNGRIMEHRLVMSEHLGRPLLPGENVHHVNGVKDDNRLSNLELWTTSQPRGRRVEDAMDHAVEVLSTYGHLVTGNALKYILRAGLKGDAIEDLRKALTYLQFEIDRRSA